MMVYLSDHLFGGREGDFFVCFLCNISKVIQVTSHYGYKDYVFQCHQCLVIAYIYL